MSKYKKLSRRTLLSGILVAGTALMHPPLAQAQTTKPVTIVVPFAAGGTTDLLGRMLAQQLGELMGRNFIVENKPGAGSAVGAATVARAPADGNTLLIATSTTLAINPSLYKKLNYDPVTDFSPVGLIGGVPLLAVVHPSLPVNNINELVALSKSRPGGLSYGSAGNGTPQHLGVEMFKAATGANMQHIPYKGSSPAIADLLGGQIDVMFSDIPPVLPHVKAGKLRAIAVTSANRLKATADVPTIAESGDVSTRDFEVVAWQSVVAPAGTPEDVVEDYATALKQVMAQPDLRGRLEADGFEPAGPKGSPQKFKRYIETEIERWAKVVKASGAQVD